MLTSSDISRYSRHLLLPEIGVSGQEKLKAASILVVGAGGLGSPLLMYLAAAGVGRIGIVEFDSVDESNLQRQILYNQADVGRPKLDAAVERLRALNPLITIEPHAVRLTSENALELIQRYDVVADGTDNVATRYLVNDACVLTNRPNVYASIFRFDGQVSIFGAHDGPCYRCLYPEPPPPGLVPSCAEGGVLGVLPGIVGSIQAVEVIKLITGAGDSLVGRLLLFDALDMSVRVLSVPRDPDCLLCGKKPEITELIDYEEFCGVPNSENTKFTGEFEFDRADLASGAIPNQGEIRGKNDNPTHQTFNGDSRVNLFKKAAEITPVELKARMDANSDLVLLDVRMPVEYEIANLGGVNIPLQELPHRLNELTKFKNGEIIVMCRSGARSGQAQAYLSRNGFPNVINLAGGIIAWSETVDGSVPKY